MRPTDNQKKLLDHFEAIQNNFQTPEYEALHPNVQDGTHPLLGSRYEIVFNVTANLLSNTHDESQDKTDTQSEKIYNHNYYVPVPEDSDKDEYITNLIKFFEDHLASATVKANKEIDNNE